MHLRAKEMRNGKLSGLTPSPGTSSLRATGTRRAKHSAALPWTRAGAASGASGIPESPRSPRAPGGGVSVALKLEEGLLSGPHPIWLQEPVFMLDSCSTDQGWEDAFGVIQAYLLYTLLLLLLHQLYLTSSSIRSCGLGTPGLHHKT